MALTSADEHIVTAKLQQQSVKKCWFFDLLHQFLDYTIAKEYKRRELGRVLTWPLADGFTLIAAPFGCGQFR